MAKIHIKRSHNLSHDEARARVEEIAKDLKDKLDADYTWDGDSLRFKRSGASGSIDVGDDVIELNVTLGMLFTPLKGKIEDTVRQHMDVVLAKSDQKKIT